MEDVEVIRIDTQEAATSIKDLRAQLKALKDQMANLEEGSDAFLEVANKAGEVKHQLDEISESIKGASADFGDMLGNVAKVGAGMVGAFQSAKAAMDLFGVESEEVIKSIKKMQDLMAITQGLTSIDDGIKALDKLRNSITATTGAAKLLKAALQPKVILALTVAITAIIAIWNKFGDSIEKALPFITKIKDAFKDTKKAAEEAAEAQQTYLEGVAASEGKLEEFQLQQKVNKLNSDAKKQYDDLTNSIKEYGLQLDVIVAKQQQPGISRAHWEQLNTEGKAILDNIHALEQQKTALLDNTKSYADNTKVVKENNDAVEDVKDTRFQDAYAQLEYNKVVKEGYADSKQAISDYIAIAQEELGTLTEGSAAWYNLASKIEKAKQELAAYGQVATEVADPNAAIDLGLSKLDFQVASGEIDEATYWQGVIDFETQRLALMDEETQKWYEQQTAIEGYKERLEQAQKSQEKQQAGWRAWTAVASAGIQAVGDVLGALAAQQDTTSKEGFEKQKKLQIGQATMNMLSGIMAAWTSCMALPAPASFILGAIQTAATATLGGIQIAAIKKQQFDSSGTSANNAAGAINNTIIPPVQYSSAIQGAETESAITDTRVYVTETDISATQERVSVQESENRY